MTEFSVIPHPGNGSGRLSRHGRIVLHASGDGPATAALIGWARSAGDKSAAEIQTELDRVVADNPSIGAFVALILDDASIGVLVHGNLVLAASTTGGTSQLGSGSHRVTGASTIALAVPGAMADPLLEVERGTVAADGFEVRVSGAAHGLSVMAPSAPKMASVIADATSTRGSGSVIGKAVGSAVGAPPVKVPGLFCSRNHFNDPRARFCARCGITMHQVSFILVDEVRPPLGVITFSDGSFETLVRSAVVGRDPSDDTAVATGAAIGLPLEDITGTISRAHAEVRLEGWDVYIVDKNSTNGTFVWLPGQTDWERLAPNKPRLISPGTHVSFGLVTATFESALQQK
jgi:hypothetical protein